MLSLCFGCGSISISITFIFEKSSHRLPIDYSLFFRISYSLQFQPKYYLKRNDSPIPNSSRCPVSARVIYYSLYPFCVGSNSSPSIALAGPVLFHSVPAIPAIEPRHWKHHYSNHSSNMMGGPTATSGFPIPTASASGFPTAYGFKHHHHKHPPSHDRVHGFLRQALGLSGII